MHCYWSIEILSFTSTLTEHIPLNRHAPLFQQHEKSMACPNTQVCSGTFKQNIKQKQDVTQHGINPRVDRP